MSAFNGAAQDRLFSSLTPSIRALALRGTLRNYPKNTIIITEGEPGDTTFVLLKGRVKVYCTNVEGRELTFDVVEAGDYFAEISLDGGPRHASVMTLEPCVCSVVTRSAFLEHLNRKPDFVMELVAHVIRRARELTRKARELALNSVYGRVVSELEGVHGPGTPDAPVLLLGITHRALASRVGASREMVSRLLKDLERGGYVQLGLKRIILRRKLPSGW